MTTVKNMLTILSLWRENRIRELGACSACAGADPPARCKSLTDGAGLLLSGGGAGPGWGGGGGVSLILFQSLMVSGGGGGGIVPVPNGVGCEYDIVPVLNGWGVGGRDLILFQSLMVWVGV